MPMIKIDGQDYDIDSLPEAAKQQLQSLQFVDNELIRLNAQTSVYKTARICYAIALKSALAPQPAPAVTGDAGVLSGDTIKFT